MTKSIVHGSADKSVTIRIIDSSDGTPETGVTSATAGLSLWYRREGAGKTSITVTDLTNLTDAHSDGGILHISDGYYRLDIPDAAFASGADEVVIGGTATGMIVLGVTVPLVAYDPADPVRLGLSSLPNASAGTASGLPVQSDIESENPFVLEKTTIATLTDQQTFTISSGSSVDGVYDRCLVVFIDPATSTPICQALISSYTGSTKTVTLTEAAADTISASDEILILASKDRISLVDTTTNNTDMLTLADINAEVDTALADYDPPTLAELQGELSLLNDLTGNEVRAEVATALQDIHLDHLFATEYNPDSKPGVSDALLNELIVSDAGVSQFSVNSLENAPGGGPASTSPVLVENLTITSVTSQTQFVVSGGSSDDDAYNNLAAVITDQTTGTQKAWVGISDYDGATQTITLSSAPIFTVAANDTIEVLAIPYMNLPLVNTEVTNALNTYDPPTKAEMDAGFAALNDVSTTDINTEVTNALNTYDPPTKTELDAGLAALNDLSAVEINTEVTNALNTYDPPTKAEMDAGFAALNDVSSQDVADAMKLAPTAGANGTGSVMDIIERVDTNVQTINSTAASIQQDTGTDIPAQISALNDVSTADVNAQVDTALADFFGSSAQLVDAIWDELLSGHTTAGSAGKALSDIDSNTSSTLTSQDVRDAMKLAPSAGAAASGSVDDYLSQVLADTSSLDGTKIPDTISLSNIADALLDEDMATHVVVQGSFAGIINNILNNAISAADTSSNIENQLPDTLSLANINAQVDTALSDIFLDKLFASPYSSLSPPGDASSFLNTITENSPSNLPQFTSGVLANVPSVSEIADGVWDEDLSGHSVSGSASDIVNRILADTDLITRSMILLSTTISTVTDQQNYVLSSGSDNNLSYSGTVAVVESASNPGRVAVVDVSSWDGTLRSLSVSSAPPFTVASGDSITILSQSPSADPSGALGDFFGSSAQLVDEIWNELLSGHTAAGSAGEVLSSAKTSADSASSSANSILARIGSVTGSGVNTILGFFQSLFRSDVTAPSDIGGTYDPATDSVQAIRDRGDAAWTTGSGSGGGGGDATLAKQQEILNAISVLPSASSISNAVWTAVDRSLTDKSGFSITASDVSSIASAVESAILDENDGNAVLAAIASAVSANLDIPASELQDIASQVRTELAVELARIDAPITSMQTGVAGLTVSGGNVVNGNLSLKRGDNATLTFDSLPAITMSHVLLGISDDSGRFMLKKTGTIVDQNTATFTITSSDSLKLFGESAKFDLFEVDNYDPSTGTYSDANRLVSGDVIIEPLYLKLETE